MKNKKLKNLKQYRNKVRFQFYVVFRPKAQKLFFPIMFLIFSVACLDHWYDNRGVWKFENTAVQAITEKTDHKESPVSISGDGTAVETAGMEKPDTPIVELIKQTFSHDPETAIAVAKSESGLDPNAKGWNCKYGTKSTSCKPEDRGKAWSVDCGIFQVNVIAQECPEHLMNPETNIRIAKEMQSKRGWNPWVGYWNGQWKNHL